MLKWTYVIAAFLCLTGCVSQKTGGLVKDADKIRVAEVQKIYDADFDAAIRADGLNVGKRRFSKTLAALPKSDQVGPAGTFYTLLEGLIYLQTGELGKAQTIAPEISGQTVDLGTDGISPRNVILGQNFADLVRGRAAVATLKSLNRDTTEHNTQRIQIVNDLDSLSSSMTRRLCKSGVVDDGAGFVAAYQASFLVEADRALTRACIPRVTDATNCAPFFESRSTLVDARNLLATFAGSLTDASQISRMGNQIERDLSQANPGAPLAPPINPCG